MHDFVAQSVEHHGVESTLQDISNVLQVPFHNLHVVGKTRLGQYSPNMPFYICMQRNHAPLLDELKKKKVITVNDDHAFMFRSKYSTVRMFSVPKLSLQVHVVFYNLQYVKEKSYSDFGWVMFANTGNIVQLFVSPNTWYKKLTGKDMLKDQVKQPATLFAPHYIDDDGVHATKTKLVNLPSEESFFALCNLGNAPIPLALRTDLFNAKEHLLERIQL